MFDDYNHSANKIIKSKKKLKPNRNKSFNY